MVRQHDGQQNRSNYIENEKKDNTATRVAHNLTTGYNYTYALSESGYNHICIDEYSNIDGLNLVLKKTKSSSRPIFCKANKNAMICVMTLAIMAILVLNLPYSNSFIRDESVLSNSSKHYQNTVYDKFTTGTVILCSEDGDTVNKDFTNCSYTSGYTKDGVALDSIVDESANSNLDANELNANWSEANSTNAADISKDNLDVSDTYNKSFDSSNSQSNNNNQDNNSNGDIKDKENDTSSVKKDLADDEYSYMFTLKGMNKSQLTVSEKLISLFENGTTAIQYAYAENIDDGVGITCGRAGFCTGTGDALEVIQNYTKINPDNLLKKYIPELKNIASKKKSSASTAGLLAIGDFYSDWEEAAKDPIFCSEQDRIFYEWYYEPSRKAADNIGAKYALTRAVLFDSAINHGKAGMNRIIRKTNNNLGATISSGISEKTWLKTFLNIREKELTVNSKSSTSCRIQIFLEIFEAENFDLDKDIVVKHRYYQGTRISPDDN